MCRLFFVHFDWNAVVTFFSEVFVDDLSLLAQSTRTPDESFDAYQYSILECLLKFWVKCVIMRH